MEKYQRDRASKKCPGRSRSKANWHRKCYTNMNKEIKIRSVLSGADILLLRMPLVYMWFRDGKCLYVGKCISGFERVVSRGHHIIGTVDKVWPDDTFRFYFLVDGETEDDLDEAEKRFIREYSPLYNIVGNPTGSTKAKELRNETEVKTTVVSILPANIQTKAELAEVLFSKMPKRLLLGNARNHSTADLHRILIDCKRKREAIKRLKKLKQ